MDERVVDILSGFAKSLGDFGDFIPPGRVPEPFSGMAGEQGAADQEAAGAEPQELDEIEAELEADEESSENPKQEPSDFSDSEPYDPSESDAHPPEDDPKQGSGSGEGQGDNEAEKDKSEDDGKCPVCPIKDKKIKELEKRLENKTRDCEAAKWLYLQEKEVSRNLTQIGQELKESLDAKKKDLLECSEENQGLKSALAVEKTVHQFKVDQLTEQLYAKEADEAARVPEGMTWATYLESLEEQLASVKAALQRMDHVITGLRARKQRI